MFGRKRKWKAVLDSRVRANHLNLVEATTAREAWAQAGISDALAEAGVRGSKAGTALNMAFARLAKPTAEGQKVLEKYGITAVHSTKAGELVSVQVSGNAYNDVSSSSFDCRDGWIAEGTDENGNYYAKPFKPPKSKYANFSPRFQARMEKENKAIENAQEKLRQRLE